MKNDLLSIAVLCLLAGCTKAPVAELRTVEVVTPESASQIVSRTYAGKVENKGEVALAFKVAGEVQNIVVHEGEKVRAGQLLAQLDSKDYELQQEINLTRYNQFKDEFARIKTLYERRAVSRNDYEKAEAGLRQLEVAKEGGQRQINYTRLYAPADGEITTVHARKSQLVDAGTPVVSFMSDSEMQVLLDVPESEQLADKQNVRLVAIKGDKEFPMTLCAIAPKADNNQLYQMRLNFQGAHEDIVPGMNLSVRIERPQDGDAALLIPLHAVFDNNGKQSVWTLAEDSTVHAVTVEVGVSRDGKAEIRAGLTGNERIVRAGVHHLTEGEKVRVLEAVPESNVGAQL